MIVSSGYNIAGPDVEAALLSAPARWPSAAWSAAPDAARGHDRQGVSWSLRDADAARRR